MKKNILTKLLALVLAVVMTLGTCITALAEVSYDKYQEVLYKAAMKFSELFMNAQNYIEAQQVASIFSGDQGENFLKLFDEEKENDLLEKQDVFYAEYLASITHKFIPPAVNYAKVAKFPANNTSVQRKFSLLNNTRAGENDKLELSKSVTDIGDGQFRIELEAYTTGTVSVVTATKPCDIVLVVDLSTSMENTFADSSTAYSEIYAVDENKTYYIKDGDTYKEVKWCSRCNSWTLGCAWIIVHISGEKVTPKTAANSTGIQFYEQITTDGQSRLEALKAAANTFISNVADQQNNNMAIVGFHDSAVNLTSGFLDVTANEATLKAAINGINSYDLQPATDHDDGLERAEALFAAQTESAERQRVVVMITDGAPEPKNKSSWSAATVKDAITSAYNLKNRYNAALYTVSVMPGTNASNPTSNMDKYMTYMSSNYPSAEYTGTYSGTDESRIVAAITPGNRAETDGSYYLTASDVATLNSIFEQITTQTGGSSVQLNQNTEIRDIVTPYFEVPAKGDVIVQTYDCTGYVDGQPTWAATGTTLENAVEVVDNTVTVTGFDFNRNFVSETGRVEGNANESGNFYGRKIKITFVTEPKDEFWGGNNVPTNGETSGVYAAGAETATGTFDVPHVNVPLNVPDMTGKDLNIYLLGAAEVTVDDLCNASDFVVDPNAEWKTKYVVITPPSYVNNDQKISGTEDTLNVNMQVVVAPSESALETSKGTPVTRNVTKTAKGNVYVYKPVLTFADSAENYLAQPKNAADYYNQTNYKGVAWKHGETPAKNMTGDEPSLALTYLPVLNSWITNGKVTGTTDVPVNVNIMIGTTDVTAYCTSIRNPEGCSDCSVKNATDETVKLDPEFIVHIKNVYGELKIIKNGLKKGESAVFTVNGTVADGTAAGTAKEWTVVLTAPDDNTAATATLTGLLVGSKYTVTEDPNWTWSYIEGEPEYSCETILALNKEGAPATVTIENTKKDKWLHFESSEENVFNGKNPQN